MLHPPTPPTHAASIHRRRTGRARRALGASPSAWITRARTAVTRASTCALTHAECRSYIGTPSASLNALSDPTPRLRAAPASAPAPPSARVTHARTAVTCASTCALAGAGTQPSRRAPPRLAHTLRPTPRLRAAPASAPAPPSLLSADAWPRRCTSPLGVNPAPAKSPRRARLRMWRSLPV